MLEKYNKCKNKLEEIYDNIAGGVTVGEKSYFFLNLEKKVVQVIIEKMEIENKEISDSNEINNEINRFFKKLFTKTLQRSLTTSS